MQDIYFEFDNQLKDIALKLIEDAVIEKQTALEKKAKPQKEVLNCPRCYSINTKFCYYNNYSLAQPRYFCKTCKRYWTEGGCLRNLPVGGGRKNKRSSLSSSNSSSSTSTSTKNIKLPELITPDNCTQNPKIYNGQDLNLTFPNISDLVQQNNINDNSTSSTSINTLVNTITTSNSHLSGLELLTGIPISSRDLHSFMPSTVQVHVDANSSFYSTCGFPLQDFKPTLNFSLDGIGESGFANLHGVDHQETSGSILFPFEDLKQVSSSTNVPSMDQNNSNSEEQEQKQQGYSSGYWGGGMLGGGGS